MCLWDTTGSSLQTDQAASENRREIQRKTPENNRGKNTCFKTHHPQTSDDLIFSSRRPPERLTPSLASDKTVAYEGGTESSKGWAYQEYAFPARGGESNTELSGHAAGHKYIDESYEREPVAAI